MVSGPTFSSPSPRRDQLAGGQWLRGPVDRLSIFLASALLILCAVSDIGAQPECPSRVVQRDRLWEEAYKLQTSGDIAAAIAAGEKMLAIERELYTPPEEQLALSLDWLAEREMEREGFVQAARRWSEALSIRTTLYGTSDWRVIDTSLNLGRAQQMEKLDRQQRQALADAQRAYKRVSVLHEQGKDAEALKLAEQVRATRVQILGAAHVDYAMVLNDMAVMCDNTGDYARAERLYGEAIEILKKTLGQSHPEYATGLNNLAEIYRRQGDYLRAEPLYRQALSIKKAVLGDSSSGYANTLNNLAALYDDMGNYARAEPLYRQAVEIYRREPGEKHPTYALGLINLALLYKKTGDYARAVPLCRQAIEIVKAAAGEAHPTYASGLNNLATMYDDMGDYSRAEPLYRQAAEIYKNLLPGAPHPIYATALNNIATMYKKTGHFARAEPLFRQVLEIIRARLGDAHPTFGSSLNNLAALYDDMGDYAQAEPLYRQALECRRKTVGKLHPLYAESLNNLATLCMRTGDYGKAEPLYQQAADIYKASLGEGHSSYALSLNNLAGLYDTTGNDARAEALYRQALEISFRLLEVTALTQAERQQLAMGRSVRYQLDSYLSLAVRAQKFQRAVYAQVLLWKGAVTLRQQLNHAARRAESAEAGKLLEQLQQVARSIANLALNTPDMAKDQAWRRQLDELTDRKEALEADLGRANTDFNRQRQVSELTPEQLQASLPGGTALIDLLEYGHSQPDPNKKGARIWQRRVAAFVLRNGCEIQMVDIGGADEITAQVDLWRGVQGIWDHANSASSAFGSDAENAAGKLRGLLWDKLVPHLGDAKQILLSPDGALSRFPLAALPGNKAGTYLIEEGYAIAFIPVPQMLPRLVNDSEKTNRVPSLLLVGDVDYGAAPGTSEQLASSRAAPRPNAQRGLSPEWSALGGTRAEIAAVRETFTRRLGGEHIDTLDGAEATEQYFRRLAPKHRYLHLATHGFFAPPQLRSALSESFRLPNAGQQTPGSGDVIGFHPGLLSGIVLAGANRALQSDQDDGILTALEVADLDLTGVELTTLSACETGLGQAAGGEGLLGLQRAFQTAGARTVVSTLWSIDDAAARALMIGFYQNLWDKRLGKLEALRQAQLKMLRQGGQQGSLPKRGIQFDPRPGSTPTRLPPYYWAAFVLSGDWQ